MAAPKGNKFWLARSTHGKAPIFETPDKLFDACMQYFEWVEANPLWEQKAFASGGKVIVRNMPKMRAMTISGLVIFLDIARRTWDLYRAREEYMPVVTRVEEIISAQKFEGAAADLLNSNIIARDLGLRDKQDVDLSGKITLQPQISINGKSE